MNREKIIEYIRQNRGTYTHDAITQNLRREGYSTSDIEEAWRVVGMDNLKPDSTYKPTLHRSTGWDCGTTLTFLVIFACLGFFIMLGICTYHR